MTLRLALTPAQQKNIAIRSIAISPDAKILAAAGDDGIVRIWNAATLRWINKITERGDPVYSVAFSKDGSYLAAAGLDGTVQVWNAGTLDHVHTFIATDDNHGRVPQYGVAFQPGNRKVYSSGADGNVWTLDLPARQFAGKIE